MVSDQEQSVVTLVNNKRMLGMWIATAWVSFFVVSWLTWSYLPEGMTQGITTLEARFVFALSHIFAVSLLLFLGFLAVGATRWQLETADASANPVCSGDKGVALSIHNRVHTQFLSNTTEQFVMFAAALLMAAPFLTPSFLPLITLMTVLWVFGRLFFWGGYWYTAYHGLATYPRAIGLGMGLLCTLSMAAIAVVGICLHYPSFSAVTGAASDMTGVSFAGMMIKPDVLHQGSNVLPVSFFSMVVVLIAALAVFPRLAPPVVPMALISSVGWCWLLYSGAVPLR